VAGNPTPIPQPSAILSLVERPLEVGIDVDVPVGVFGVEVAEGELNGDDVVVVVCLAGVGMEAEEEVLVVAWNVIPSDTYAVHETSVQQVCLPENSTQILPTVQYRPVVQHCPFRG
jgi:hypothetical protein